jgi:hypothetical protein
VIPVKLDDCADDDIPILLYDKRSAHIADSKQMDELLAFVQAEKLGAGQAL